MTDKPKLLLVDDEASNIQMLAENLRPDYAIYFALKGEGVLETVKGQSIDLVLLDVEMPDMDGFDVLRRLKDDAATQDIPVIFVTSRDDIEDETRGLKMGAVDYVSKPFRPAVVKARINTHLALKRQRELLERHALIDGLTEIGNRRQFDSAMSQRWRTHLRAASPLGLVMLDIDHFKDYNDHYGHAAGDHCLKQVARCLSATFARADDVVTRYGGEEFAIITNTDSGRPFRDHLQTLLEDIGKLRIEHARSKVADHVTVSVGAVRTRPESGTNDASMIESSDGLLYQAKKDGRNRCWYRDEVDDLLECIKGAGP